MPRAPALCSSHPHHYKDNHVEAGACALARGDFEDLVEGKGHVLQGQNEGGSAETFCLSTLAEGQLL